MPVIPGPRRYIRHNNGVIHDVPASQYAAHLAQARSIRQDDPTADVAREATPEEVAAHWAKQGFVYIPETDEALTAEEAAARKPAKSAKGDN